MSLFFSKFCKFILITLLSSCSILIGNISPNSRKTKAYEVTQLFEIRKDWNKLTIVDEFSSQSDPDLAYRTRDGTSAASLNTYCRTNEDSKDRDLDYYTNQLLVGLSEPVSREASLLQIDHTPALKTVIEGTFQGKRSKLEIFVVKNRSCVFDIIFVSDPESFPKYEPDFKQFVDSLRFH
jgi:hypothetical protein